MFAKHSVAIAVWAAGSMVAAAGLTGCSLGKPPITEQELHRLETLHDRFCKDDDQHVVSYLLDDRSNSESEVVNTTFRMPAIRQEVELAVICNGTVSVNDFAGSTSASVNLFQGTVGTSTGTVASRMRKVPKETDAVMAQVEAAQAGESGLLDRKGTNIEAQLTSAEAFFRTFPEGTDQFRVVVLTDGASTSTVASPVRFPSHTTVVFAGIGVFGPSHPQPSQERIDAMETALDQACAPTGATCIPATPTYDGVAVTTTK